MLPIDASQQVGATALDEVEDELKPLCSSIVRVGDMVEQRLRMPICKERYLVSCLEIWGAHQQAVTIGFVHADDVVEVVEVFVVYWATNR